MSLVSAARCAAPSVRVRTASSAVRVNNATTATTNTLCRPLTVTPLRAAALAARRATAAGSLRLRQPTPGAPPAFPAVIFFLCGYSFGIPEASELQKCPRPNDSHVLSIDSCPHSHPSSRHCYCHCHCALYGLAESSCMAWLIVPSPSACRVAVYQTTLPHPTNALLDRLLAHSAPVYSYTAPAHACRTPWPGHSLSPQLASSARAHRSRWRAARRPPLHGRCRSFQQPRV
jgi:hypothetical protein